jgi:hypothetical protein
MKVARLSALLTGRLYPPRRYHWYSFLLKADPTRGLQFDRKRRVNEKFQSSYQELNQRPSGFSRSSSPNRATAYLLCLKQQLVESAWGNTRWLKYDRDDLCVNKSQFVPVIFEPLLFAIYFDNNIKYKHVNKFTGLSGTAGGVCSYHNTRLCVEVFWCTGQYVLSLLYVLLIPPGLSSLFSSFS